MLFSLAKGCGEDVINGSLTAAMKPSSITSGKIVSRLFSSLLHENKAREILPRLQGEFFKALLQ